MGAGQGVGDGQHYPAEGLLAQRARGGQVVEQVAALDMLHDDKVLAFEAEVLDVLDDVGVVEPAQDTGFQAEVVEVSRVAGQTGVEGLDRHPPVVLPAIDGQEDLAHAAPAQRLDQRITFVERFPDHSRPGGSRGRLRNNATSPRESSSS